MFKTRLLSGIVLVIAALVLIITGGDVLLISTLIISYIGMFELYRIFHIEKEAVGIIGYLAATVYYCNLKFAFLPDTMVFVLGVLILMMFAYVFTYPKYKTEQVLAAFLCCCDAVVCVSDAYDRGRCLHCMACFSVFLGMRHLCILCRNVDWKT